MTRGFKPATTQDILNKAWSEGLNALVVYVGPVGTAIFTGAKTAIGTTAGTLSTTQACSAVMVQADLGNGTVNLLVGNSTAQPMQLAPGATITLPVSDVNVVYVKSSIGTTGTANWVAIGGV